MAKEKGFDSSSYGEISRHEAETAGEGELSLDLLTRLARTTMLQVSVLMIAWLFSVGALLAWYAWDRYSGIEQHSREFMERSAKGVARGLSRFISDLHQSVRILTLGESFFRPRDETVSLSAVSSYQALGAKLRIYFPSVYTFAIADKNGYILMNDSDHPPGKQCIQAIAEFSQHREQYRLGVHVDGKIPHFDILVPWQTSAASEGVLMLSFPIEELSGILSSYEVTGHRFFLVRADRAGTVEVTSRGAAKPADDKQYEVSLKRGNIGAIHSIPGTWWNLVAVPSDEVSSGALKELLWMVSLVYMAFVAASVFMVRLVRRQERMHESALNSLRHSEGLLRAILSHSPASMYIKDRMGRYLLANRRFESQLEAGCDVLGKTDREIFSPDIARVFRMNDLEVLNNKMPMEFEESYRINGLQRTNLSIKFPLLGLNGNAESVCGISTDITERKRIERELIESNRKIVSLLESSTDAYIAVDEEMKVSYFNGEGERLFRCSRKDVIGRHIWETFPTLEGFFADAFSAALRRKEVTRIEKHHEPLQCWLETYVYPSDEGLWVFMRDITQKKLAEDGLKSANRLLNKIFASLDHALFLLDPVNLTIITCNPTTERMFGYRVKELLGASSEILHVDHGSHETLKEMMIEALDTKGGLSAEFRMKRSNGKIFPADHTVTEILDDEGHRTGIVSIIRDITEQKRIETELREHRENLEQLVVERTRELSTVIEELESFSYSVSHDLRAPLRTINGFSQALREDCSAQLDATGRSYLERIAGAASRMNELIDGLLVLSRVTRRDIRRNSLNLGEMAGEIVRSLRDADPHRRVRFEKKGNLDVCGDQILVTLLLENLLNNAWKFTCHRDEALIEIGQVRENSETVFYVRDNGVGFDMKYARKLFQPFQRLHSNEDFEGTGIGLATVYRIIQRHGGKTWAESEPGHGTMLKFTLGDGTQGKRAGDCQE